MNPIVNTTRRGFIRQLLFLGVALPLLGRIGKSFAANKKEAALPAGMVAVPASDPVASAIKYNPEPGAANKKPCQKCAFYTSVSKDWGKCQLLSANPNGVVTASGTCNSWQQKK